VHEIGMNWPVLGFAAAMTLITGTLFGIAPAWQASRTQPAAALMESGRTITPGSRQRRLRAAFVGGEIALSLVLLTGAGLLLRTVTELLKVDAGFEANGVLLARTWIAVPNDPDADRYRTIAARTTLAREILRRLQLSPEIASAAVTTALPVSQMTSPVPVQIDGRPNEADATTAALLMVTPEYFSTLRIPLRHGRTFSEGDDENAQHVAVIDEAAALRFFPGDDPLGKRITVGRAGPRATPSPATVVGVVGNAKYGTLDEDLSPHVYAPLYQRSGRALGIVVKTKVDPGALHDLVRRAVEGADGDLPVFGVQSLEDKIGQSIARQRFAAQTVIVFGLLALVLAAVGVYGVMAYAVETRVHEVGVRMAMGATPGAVLASVLREALRTAAGGIAVGVFLSFFTGRFIRGLLYDVSTGDPGVFATSGALLVVTALLASYFPARRAATADPLIALRRD
jgi:putative ABC transport system permease protein